MTSWLLIAGDFVPLGGMDRANHALARHLAADNGNHVHLVAHQVWPDLAQSNNVTIHRVPRPLGSHLLGAPLLAAEGHRRARGFAGRVIANGGNAPHTGDVSWVHYVHGAYEPAYDRITARIRGQAAHGVYVAREVWAVHRARIVVCNSRRTADDVRRMDVPAERIRVVYYGSDPAAFSLVTAAERTAARAALGWPIDRPVVLFIGALGDRRKGFDRLFDAWCQLCGDGSWDADLAVAGHGSELARWQRRARDAALGSRIRFLGFRDDVARVLAASDLLVHPARYEAYGLGVHEAICRGLPAIVGASAGVAELYPAELSDLLIRDVEDSTEIADRIHRWRWDVDAAAARVRGFSDRLRSRTWRDMSVEIERAVAG
jgi:glycosyltransferase involved in cell wall biosynthesis